MNNKQTPEALRLADKLELAAQIDYYIEFQDALRNAAAHLRAAERAAPAAVAGPSEAVAYLDIGTGGYLDLGTDLADEALSRLPKGRHALVIAGTYGIDGYTAAPTTQPAPQQGTPLMPKGDSAAPKLRAMATNYPAGHLWDKLDAKACIRGALEIEALRASHGQAPAQPTPLEFTKEWCMAAAKAEEDSGADISAGVPVSPQAAQQAPAGATDPWQQHMANQAEVIDCEALQRAMVQHGISFPEGGMEYFRASLGEMVNRFVRFAAPAAPSTPEAGGWMPIETAPRDGTRFLAAARINCSDGTSRWERHAIYVDEETGIVFYDGGDDTGWELTDYRFWQPLPASPTIEGESNG